MLTSLGALRNLGLCVRSIVDLLVEEDEPVPEYWVVAALVSLLVSEVDPDPELLDNVGVPMLFEDTDVLSVRLPLESRSVLELLEDGDAPEQLLEGWAVLELLLEGWAVLELLLEDKVAPMVRLLLLEGCSF